MFKINDDDKGGYMSCYEDMNEDINNDTDGWATSLFCILIILFIMLGI